MTAAQIKVLVSVALVLALWRVFEIPGVATAFWLFITVGDIPGTDRTVATETLLRALCILFAIIFFLVFRKEFMASLPRRKSRDAVLETVKRAELIGKMVTAVSAPAFQARNCIIVALTARPAQPALTPVRPAVIFLGRLAAWIIQLTCWLEADCRRLGRRIARQVEVAYHWTTIRVARIARKIYRGLLAVSRYLVFTAILAWKLAEPHIRRFDRWLDKQLHANKSTAEALDFMTGVSKAAREAYRHAEQASRRLRENK